MFFILTRQLTAQKESRKTHPMTSSWLLACLACLVVSVGGQQLADSGEWEYDFEHDFILGVTYSQIQVQCYGGACANPVQQCELQCRFVFLSDAPRCLCGR